MRESKIAYLMMGICLGSGITLTSLEGNTEVQLIGFVLIIVALVMCIVFEWRGKDIEVEL